MTTPLRKPYPSLVSFEFRVSSFEFENGSTIILQLSAVVL